MRVVAALFAGLTSVVFGAILDVRANDFFLKGKIAVHESSGAEVKSFNIAKRDHTGVAEIAVSEGSYQKRLEIATYSNSTIVFDFPSARDAMLFTADQITLDLGSSLQEGKEIEKDFTFFPADVFVKIIVDHIDKIDHVENCDEFLTYSNHVKNLSSATVSSPSDYYRLLRAANWLFYKIAFHKCSSDKITTIIKAIENLLGSTAFIGLRANEKGEIGKEVSFAISKMASDVDGYRGAVNTALALIDIIVGDLTKAPVVDEETANLIYARSNHTKATGDGAGAKSYMHLVLTSNALREFPDIKGSVLYDLFLIISGAEGTADDFIYRNPMPSEEGFLRSTTEGERSDWCFLYRQFGASPAIGAKWQRKGIRTRMRSEIKHIADHSFCEGET